MIIHCKINNKPKVKKGDIRKALKVEYILNRGYWAKWYLTYSAKHAKQLFEEEFPDGVYCRTKSF